MQLYFKAPFNTKKTLQLLKECIEESLKQKILKQNDLCKVELVTENIDEPTCGWQAIRFTCRGSTSMKFRKCAQNILLSKDLPEDIISTRKPSAKSSLYR